jgi:transcriptional regulator with XRE-family HTH domain
MSLGKRVQKRREELGLSQAELGERINKDKSRISRLENDQWIPDKDALLRLALALECTVAYLTGDVESAHAARDTSAAQLATLTAENDQLKQRVEADQGMIEFLKSTVKQLLERFSRGGVG